MTDRAIYFVSDTHLGDGTGADRFLYPEQLMRLLSRIESEPGAHLVLLGDFLELWASSLEGVLIHNAPIFDALGRLASTHPVTYVVGNHDCLPWYYYLNRSMGLVRVLERFELDRPRLVALHGHQYDPFNRVTVTPAGQVKAPWVRKLVQLIGFLGRSGGEATGDALADLGNALAEAADALDLRLPHWDALARASAKGMLALAREILERESPGERGYPDGETLYEEAARGLMRAGARYVVMGHTHHPLMRRYGNRVYLNTGSWVWDRYPPTYGRLAGGRLELMNAITHEPYGG